MDFEVVKTEAQEFDRWVTGLVDLIPTQVYVSIAFKGPTAGTKVNIRLGLR